MAKLKLKSKWYTPRRYAPRDHWLGLKGRQLAAHRAVEYARWIAQRDGVALPDVPGQTQWDRAPNRDWRPCAVTFGAVRIAIPNWGHIEQPPVVEHAAD